MPGGVRRCLGYIDETGRRFECRALVPRGRCDRCRRGHDRARRGTTAQRGYHDGWDELSRSAIAEHVATWGWICPGGAGHPPHPSHDLTLDHVRNGDRSLTRVVCRSFNTAKRNRQARTQGGGLGT